MEGRALYIKPVGVRRKKRLLIAGGAFLWISIFVSGVVIVKKIVVDPKIPFLFAEQGAEWICFNEPVVLKARGPQILASIFRTQIVVSEVPREAVLSFRAMKRATVLLDNQVLYRKKADFNEWKKLHCVNLAPKLSLGSHELRIEVLNQNGYPALLAYCKQLGLFTEEHWKASFDGTTWGHALLVKRTKPCELSRKFQRADKAFLSQLHFFFPLFTVIFVCTLLFSKVRRFSWFSCITPTANGMRSILLASWVILALNNIRKIPLCCGMDHSKHMEYIHYLASTMHLPFATDGWSMFHPPLFYLFSAIIYKLFLDFLSLETVCRILRILPLLC